MQTFLDAPVAAVILETLGWVLVHSIWQFAADAGGSVAAGSVPARGSWMLPHEGGV